MIPLILDHRPAYLGGGRTCDSLLCMPLGRGTVLSHMLARIGCVENNALLIVTTFPPSSEYKQRISAISEHPFHAIEARNFPQEIERFEPQDSVCVFDPSCRPLAEIDLVRILRGRRHSCGVSHIVAVNKNNGRAGEYVECDGEGKIKRVQRVFGSAGLPGMATSSTVASFMTASVLQNLRFSSLAELRIELVQRGVLGVDIPLDVDVADLRGQSDLLKFNEWVLRHADRNASKAGSGGIHDECLSAETAFVHPSVRTIGSVVIQQGATVERDVTLVGPAVLGIGSHIAAGATVAQSLVAAYAHVGPNTDVLHRVVSGEWTGDCMADAPENRRVSSVQLESKSISGGGGNQEVAIKRAMDLVLAIMGTLFLALPLLIAAILIKLDSRGPVLFSQQREGKGGRFFWSWQFRTMIPGADRRQSNLDIKSEVDDPHIRIADNPRITRLGHWLRRTHIDQLPQLFNVILGDMSLVGPRPSPFRENQICAPWRRCRLSVKPGLTGLWQICRNRGNGADFHEWIFYDMLYVRNQSVWLDLKILIATILTLGGRWAVPTSWLIRSKAIAPGQGPAPSFV